MVSTLKTLKSSHIINNVRNCHVFFNVVSKGLHAKNLLINFVNFITVFCIVYFRINI